MQDSTHDMEDLRGTIVTVIVSIFTLFITNMDLINSFLSALLTTITIAFVCFKFYVWLNKEFKDFKNKK